MTVKQLAKQLTHGNRAMKVAIYWYWTVFPVQAASPEITSQDLTYTVLPSSPDMRQDMACTLYRPYSEINLLWANSNERKTPNSLIETYRAIMENLILAVLELHWFSQYKAMVQCGFMFYLTIFSIFNLMWDSTMSS